MELHIKSIFIFLSILIKGHHAALIGSKQQIGPHKKTHDTTHRKLIGEYPTLFNGFNGNGFKGFNGLNNGNGFNGFKGFNGVNGFNGFNGNGFNGFNGFNGLNGGQQGRGGHSNVQLNPLSGLNVDAGGPRGGAKVNLANGGLAVNAGSKERPVFVGVKPGLNPFQYNYIGRNDANNPGRSLFFLEKDMKPGHRLKLNFTQFTNKARFIPREMARSIPFSTDKMPEILHKFSVRPGSEEAKTIQETIRGCEIKGIPGEQKYCATCLEDMIDYAEAFLGKNIQAISTDAKNEYTNSQRYTIGDVIKRTKNDDTVMVCHKLNYAYAVYYCHKNKGTRPHVVSLIGEKGRKVNVVAVCHKDTSNWNPKHLAFQVLNVKPGSLPICHFLPQDHIVWVRT